MGFFFGFRLRLLARRLAVAFAAVLILLSALCCWLSLSRSGLRALAWGLAWASDGAVAIEGGEGRLIGPLTLSRLRVDLPMLKLTVEGLEADWSPAALRDGRLVITRLWLGAVEGEIIRDETSTATPGVLPASLRPPIDFDLSGVAVGALTLRHADTRFNLRAARLDVRGEQGGEGKNESMYRLRELAADLPFGTVHIEGELAAEAPFALALHGQLAGTMEKVGGYTASFDADGDLRSPRLAVRAQFGEAWARAQLELSPFDALPLKALDLDVDALDPSVLAADLPGAMLRLHARFVPFMEGAWAVRGPVEIANTRPGALDGNRIPWTRLAANVELDAQRLKLADLALDGAGGAIRGELDWRWGKVPRSAAQTVDAGSACADVASAYLPPLPAALGDLYANVSVTTLDPARVDTRLPSLGVNGQSELRLDATRQQLALVFDLDAGKALAGQGKADFACGRLDHVDSLFIHDGNRLRIQGSGGRIGDKLTLEIDVPKLGVFGHDLSGQAWLRGEGRVERGGGLATTLRLGVAKLGFATVDEIDAEFDGIWAMERWQGRLTRLESRGAWPLKLLQPAALAVAKNEAALTGAGFDAGRHGHIRLDEIRWMASDGTAATLNGASENALGNVFVAVGSLRGLTLAGEFAALRTPRTAPLILGADWNLRVDDHAIEGEARLFHESGDLSLHGEIATRLGLERFEAQMRAHERRLALTLIARARELGEVNAHLDAGIEGAGLDWRLSHDDPLAGAVSLNMPSIAWLGRLWRENVEVAGQIGAEVSLSGTLLTPDMKGQIKGSALQVALVDQGLILDGGVLEATFDQNHLRLDRLVFESSNRVTPNDNRLPVAQLTASPGRLLLSGELALGRDDGETNTEGAAAASWGRGQIDFTAERLPLLQRPDRWLLISGAGTLKLASTLDVDAKVHADAGFFRIDETPPPSLGDDVIIRQRRDGESAAGTGLGLSGKIAIDLGNALRLDAFGIDTRLGGALDVFLRPGAQPRFLGTISTIGGRYRGYGQRLEITRGAITFQGEMNNPGLNITALRRGLEVEAGVAITGSAKQPRVRLVSEPEVSDPEKLSWLVLGRPPDASEGADFGLLMPAAQALLGGPGGGMSEELAHSLGFDSVTFGQGDLNSTRHAATSKVVGGGSRVSAGPTVSGDVLAVGKRLSKDVLLSFEQSVGGAESLVKLTWQLSRNLSLIARGGSDNAFDLYYTFSFR
ncbi:MAG: translocation/assembly module TamB domain-containing protein [Azoarcus sp.]|jgi:translocation and assembly module TamB|nr:translocation/assembly module TamB domain-containing protein [Azoarcus sp.]